MVTSFRGSVFSGPTDAGDYRRVAESTKTVDGRKIVTKRWMDLFESCRFGLRGSWTGLIFTLFLLGRLLQTSCSVIWNRIGMKFCRIVLRVNTHRLSDMTS